MITKIVLESLTLSSDTGYHLQRLNDLGFRTKYAVAKVMQNHGAKIGEVFYENRVMSFEFIVTGTTIEEFIARRDALYTQLKIKQYEPDELNLDIYLANGRTVRLTGVVRDVSAPLTTDVITSGTMAFTIECETPFFLSAQTYQVDVPITKGGGTSIPTPVPVNMTAGSGGSALVANGGTTFAFPMIYLYGPLENPVLTNTTLGKTLSIAATITGSGNYYLIDTYDRIVTDQAGTNKRDKMSGDFLIVDVGENLFTLATDNPADTGYARLIYQYPYISL